MFNTIDELQNEVNNLKENRNEEKEKLIVKWINARLESGFYCGNEIVLNGLRTAKYELVQLP